MVEGFIIAWVLLFILISTYLYIPTLMSKRAAEEVIGRFCRFNAVSPEKARTEEEMGLAPPDLMQRLSQTRDYKPLVVQSLKRAGIVHTKEDGKIYLDQDKVREEFRCN